MANKKYRTRNGVDYIYWTSQLTVGYDPISGKRIRKTITGKTQKFFVFSHAFKIKK